MKIELKSREESAYKLLCSSASEATAAAELIIPDTMEDIQRIICCRPQCRIREKSIKQERLFVSGEVDATVLYIPDGADGTGAIGVSMPFEISFPADGADSTSVSVTNIVSVLAEARAVNPRKLSVSAEIAMEQRTYKYADRVWYEPPENAHNKLFFKTGVIETADIALAAEKTLSIEDELDVPERCAEGDFVKAFSSIKITGSEVIGAKAVVKASVYIEALYMADGIPRTAKFTVPVSQIFTLPEGCESPMIIAVPMITGQYYESRASKLSADIRAAIQIVCIQKRTVHYIEDSYSCVKHLDTEMQTQEFLTSYETKMHVCRAKLAYNSDYGVDEVISAVSSVGMAEPTAGSEAIPITADVVYKDGEGCVRSCRIRGGCSLSSDIGTPERIAVNAVNVSVSESGGTIEAEVELELMLEYISRESIEMICSVSQTEQELVKPAASVYICRCSDNELWSAAKKYCSDIELIKDLNELDDEGFTDRMLLIPVL